MKPKINQLINKSVVQLKRGSPTVLTCLGVAGVIATTVSAVMTTPKAIEKIRKDSLINHDGDPCGYSKTEAIKSAWVYYIPSTVIGVSTIICIVGANVLNRHQQAALSSAYALINKSYNEYKEKLKELYGEEAHQKIIDSIAKERYFRVGVAAAELMVPLIFYGIWMRKGFKFEETGTYTSKTFTGLINRFKPTKK